MKRFTHSCLLRAMAMSALTNLALPVAEAWAAEEVQVLRRSAPNAESGNGVVPFTTFQQEELALTESVPCKWISRDGRLGPSYGGGRYDFLCKGGNFATVSVYLDKANSPADGVGKVRMLYRDWPVNTNPNAGEAEIAQKYLQHVVGRFVPAAIAGEVMDAFWAKKSKSWTQGGVAIRFEIEKGAQFNVRRLEIAGTETALNRQVVPMFKVLPQNAGLTKPDSGTKVFVYGKDGEPVAAPARVLPGVAVTTGMPARVPHDAGLTKPTALNPVVETPTLPTQVQFTQQPAAVVPIPTAILPLPGSRASQPAGMLVVPVNAPASAPKTDDGAVPLQPANSAELNTAPAPESKEVPAAPPTPSDKLVPTTDDHIGGRQRAPSNFEAYNRAVELTKDTEKRAQISKVDQAKVTASKPVSSTAYVTPSTVAVPSLTPVLTPQMNKPADVAPVQAPVGEGLGAKAAPTLDEVPLPTNYNGPRSTEARPLPQLKFVPKAEPLAKPDDVIQFEDEKSRL